VPGEQEAEVSVVADWRLSKTYDYAGGMVAYEVLGLGAPVVLVHGTPSWSYLWRNVASKLGGRFTVYLCDLLGYGTSEKREGQDVSIGAQTRMLTVLLDLHMAGERGDSWRDRDRVAQRYPAKAPSLEQHQPQRDRRAEVVTGDARLLQLRPRHQRRRA
jgi:pimeloyl-ACP methyl ester carboxylesterase